MKALVFDRYGPPDVLQVRELPIPQPGPGQLLVRVHALPVGPGDCKLRAGALRDFFEITFPKISGRYASGLVEAVGPGVSAPCPGDEVVLASLHHDTGAAAEYVVRTPDQVTAKPAASSHVETAALIQGGVSAWACLVGSGRVAHGDRVLVHGAAGAVGSACVELARHLGAEVTAVCRSSDLAFVRGLGAHHAVAFDVPGEVERMTSHDVVIDLVGGAVHALSCRLLRPGGRLVYLNALPLVLPDAGPTVAVINALIDDRGSTLRRVLALAERGVLRPRTAAILPLEQASAAHRMVEAGQARRGRVVLTLRPTPEV